MLQDRYGNALSTTSTAARDAYVDGIDRFLAAQSGAEEAFEAAVAADPDFALGQIGLARIRQAMGQGHDVAGPAGRAAQLAEGLSEREAAHVTALGLLVSGQGPAAYKAIRAHLLDHPRDALVAQTCTGVFGLIGFSGQPGREAEQLAFTAALAGRRRVHLTNHSARHCAGTCDRPYLAYGHEGAQQLPSHVAS